MVALTHTILHLLPEPQPGYKVAQGVLEVGGGGGPSDLFRALPTTEGYFVPSSPIGPRWHPATPGAVAHTPDSPVAPASLPHSPPPKTATQTQSLRG